MLLLLLHLLPLHLLLLLHPPLLRIAFDSAESVLYSRRSLHLLPAASALVVASSAAALHGSAVSVCIIAAAAGISFRCICFCTRVVCCMFAARFSCIIAAAAIALIQLHLLLLLHHCHRYGISFCICFLVASVCLSHCSLACICFCRLHQLLLLLLRLILAASALTDRLLHLLRLHRLLLLHPLLLLLLLRLIWLRLPGSCIVCCCCYGLFLRYRAFIVVISFRCCRYAAFVSGCIGFFVVVIIGCYRYGISARQICLLMPIHVRFTGCIGFCCCDHLLLAGHSAASVSLLHRLLLLLRIDQLHLLLTASFAAFAQLRLPFSCISCRVAIAFVLAVLCCRASAAAAAIAFDLLNLLLYLRRLLHLLRLHRFLCCCIRCCCCYCV
jgi:hypothetical protein